MTTVYLGYNETPYLDAPVAYAGGQGFSYTAYQAAIQIINQETPFAAQSTVNILDSKLAAMQASLIINAVKSYGSQVGISIDDERLLALQSQLLISAQKIGAMQALLEISDANFAGFQASLNALESTYAPTQADVTINDTTLAPMQSLATIDTLEVVALQSEMHIQDSAAAGYQAKLFIEQAQHHLAMAANIAGVAHYVCESYLVEPYLSMPYLVSCNIAVPGFQANIIGQDQVFAAMQADLTITKTRYAAMQASLTIASEKLMAMQGNLVIQDSAYAPMQSEVTINDLQSVGFQSDLTITAKQYAAFQATLFALETVAMQTRIVIYNTDNLRILVDFPSRGVTGMNWTANSTQAGDFNVNNLNTDQVEQIWRSATGVLTGLELICDTQITQGVFVDTVALLNCNFSGTASVELDASNDPGFATVETIVIPLERKKNAYYIAPTLPLTSYRYWRFRIEDSGNPNNFVSIGTIVFGSAVIFAGECFTDVVKFGRRQYADQVATEGFTNVKNDRGQKNYLGLDFKNLNYNKPNYANLVQLFETQSTLLKCLWIPTPRYPSRFAVFGKLTELPQESHNDRGEGHDYIELSVNVDEAE